jgi:hypothetical protein
MLDYERLNEFLRNEYATDILMVCEPGKKCPAFSHSNSEWDWNDFDKMIKNKNYDIGILLQQLCVIDVDTIGQARELESRFPELLRAPCETTRQGMHYYFIRSEKADSDGYYDGAGQVEKGIDFKTKCQNGTSGFIIVSPSTNKEWVIDRDIWSTDLFPISDDLLTSVARARHPRIKIQVNFTDTNEILILETASTVMHFEVFKMFLEEFFFNDINIPIPNCTKELFQDLLFACEKGATRQYPTKDHVTSLLALADFLGAPLRVLRAFRAGGYVNRMQDIEKECGNMAYAMHDEMLFRHQYTQLKTIEVTDFEIQRHGPFIKNTTLSDGWLFNDSTTLPPIKYRPKITCPSFAIEWLSRHSKLVLAGGGALSAIIDEQICKPGDYDFFLIDATKDEANEIINELISQPGTTLLYQSKNAITLSTECGQTAQIILRMYESHEHLLVSFDIQPCKVLICSSDGKLIGKATRSWFISMSSRAFFINIDSWGAASYIRVLKYAAKQFDVFVPCTSRMQFKNFDNITHGVGKLFAFQDKRVKKKWWWSSSNELPLMVEVAREVQHIYYSSKQTSDYELYKRITYSVYYYFIWMKTKLFGTKLIPKAIETIKWHPAPRNSNFQPQNPGWLSLYNTMNWAKIQVPQLYEYNFT